MSDDALRAKISKMLNMTTANGCTEDEQESAMRMAAGLAARAGIDLSTLKPGESKSTKRSAKSKTVTGEYKVHQVLAAQSAAQLYGVNVYTYGHGKDGLLFVGREELIENTEDTWFWLMRQVELLYKENLPRGLTQRDRAEYRKTFKAACASRVLQRAINLMREMKTNERQAQSATGQNALVVQSYFATLNQEIDEYFGRGPEDEARRKKREEERLAALTSDQRATEDAIAERGFKKMMNRKGPRPRMLPTGSGTDAGVRAGDTIKLRKEVT